MRAPFATSGRAILLCFLCAAACAAEKVRIGLPPQLISASVLLAKEQGYFSQEGLAVELVDFVTGKDALVKLFAGELDFAVAAETPLVFAALNGEQFRIMATLGQCSKALALVGRRDRGVDGFSRVRGKKVGITRGTNAEFFFDTFRVLSGIEPGAVEVSNIEPDQLEESILSGRCDAIITWDPALSRVKEKLGANGYSFDGDGLYRWSWNLVARANSNLKSVETQKLLRAIQRTGREIEADPAQASRLIEKKVNIPWERIATLLADYEFKPQLRQELILQMEAQYRWLMRRQEKPLPNLLRYIETGPLKAISPDAVTILE